MHPALCGGDPSEDAWLMLLQPPRNDISLVNKPCKGRKEYVVRKHHVVRKRLRFSKRLPKNRVNKILTHYFMTSSRMFKHTTAAAML
ncbi:MAG: hypothetical protein SGJ20_17360, partial [Planctomycetota bacterium]|nr:hypothetical protein [Planctomycetota bacterium]